MTQNRPTLQDGLVIANFGNHIAVENAQGDIHCCVARKKVGTVICGDQVRWSPQNEGLGAIVDVLPRTSILSRPDRRNKLKPVCANVSQLAIVNAIPSSDNNTNTRLLDQYLVASELSGIEAIIVINKADLINSNRLTDLKAQLRRYSDLGYPVIFSSATTQVGMSELRNRLHHKRSVLVGESGVGKSSLINILIPDLDIRIGALSSASGKGRHTTTTTTLYHLACGGEIIDSPGVREFGLWHITAPELEDGFKEFREYKGRCKYRNCKHIGEDGCAIAMAVDEGKIDPNRLSSYREIMNSLCQY